MGEAFPRPPVNLAGVILETAETFPPYSLAYQRVCFVEARGVASRRYTDPPAFGQNLLGGKRVCFVVEVHITGTQLRAQQGVQGDRRLRQRAFAR